MTSLSIYVEKWYIVGAVCTDNVPHVIELPNHEDRIWLYFFEDVANDAIYYGRANKQKAQNKENHYIDDVFSKIVESDASFKKFGLDYPLAEIFKYSCIFDDLKSAFRKWSNDSKIPVYISFSQDISYDAQNIFKEELEKNDFEVRQFAGKIDFLALEWVKRAKHLSLPLDKHALVLCSTNENLHMSLFKTDGSNFLEEGNDNLAGYGNDVRRHAVIEDVVKQGNATFHFLTKEEDFSHEKIRMEEFAEDWILKLDLGKAGIPVKIPNISFSLAPNNQFTANLKRAAIDDRTKAIIRVIIDKVKKFVIAKNSVHEYDLGAVILLGNSFGNSQYFNELDSWLQIRGEQMFRIDEATLPNVVGVYSQIDPSYFSSAENVFAELAGMERERQIQTEQEELERNKAKAAADKVRQSEAAKSLAEKKYKDAMDQAYEAESKHDFANMREFLTIALDARPYDDTASKKLQQLNDMEMKEELKNAQYRAAINQADKALESGDLELAFSFYTQALTIEPNSDHAKTRLDKVKKARTDKKKSSESLTRAEVLEGQKLYEKALTELRKAQLLDPSNSEISAKIASIEKMLKEKEDSIQTLKKQIEDAESSDNYEAAIVACETIISEDESNKFKWERKLDFLKESKAKYEEKVSVLAECYKNVTDASFNDKWDDVRVYAAKALKYSPTDEFFLKHLQKATKELSNNAISTSSKAIIDKVRGSDRNVTEGVAKNVWKVTRVADDFFDNPKKSSSKAISGGESFWGQKTKDAKPEKKDDFFDTTDIKGAAQKKNIKDGFDF